MPNLFTNNVSPVSAANINRLTYLGGSLTGGKILAGRLRYTGTLFEFASSTFAAELSGNPPFAAGVATLTVVGYTLFPLILATPTIATALYPKAVATAAGTIQVRWFDATDTLVTVASTNMDCNLLILGN